jgi:hypothetical protein
VFETKRKIQCTEVRDFEYCGVFAKYVLVHEVSEVPPKKNKRKTKREREMSCLINM